jgi:CRP/FNR family transcriptional regulator, dissimilatory nitrate respiration regulator
MVRGEWHLQDCAFDLPRYLAALPLFRDMLPDQLQRLAEGSRLRRFTRGDVVFRIGEPCVEFYVTVFGQVKLFALSAGGQEKVLELVGPGMSFAEAPMFVGGTHRVNGQALADTLLLVISKQAVLAEIAHDPAFALRMLAGLSRRLHRLMDDVEAYALHTGLRRVVDYLLHELEGNGPASTTVSLPTSKATVALRLSLTPEYFSRMLHQLEAAGLIHIAKRAICIHSPECLRAFSELEHDETLVCPRAVCLRAKTPRTAAAA